MRFPTLPISPVILVILGLAVPGHPADAQTIVGRLLDGDAMQPVPHGFIELLDTAAFQVAATRSDERGDFTVSAPGPGEYLIRAEAFLYHSIEDGPVALNAGETTRVEFFILPKPEELDPLVIAAKRTDFQLRTAGFYRRQERGMGQFITRDDIEDIRPHDLSSLLAWGVLGVMLRPNRVGAMIPAFPAGRSSTESTRIGWCYPMYFLNGLPFDFDLDEFSFPVHPNDLAAVEVYHTRGETPAQFRDPRASCGTILLWTRWKEEPRP
ncbi:MAG: carboxypeptidase regulatory-like domain-containing protein [Gemmatimonadetes bacterium]|nr:carboxypeptidase-like regulatory domain-containing protein [Gemmatimonadota bacterium]NNM04788.1 carboxypeptidase regulatory-like domain-containing protein [Gemmatimonadota bacterium]